MNESIVKKNETTTPRTYQAPRAELTTTDDGANIRFLVPGADADSVDVTLEEDRLTISARVEETVPEGYAWTYRERPMGDWRTTVIVPFEVGEDGVSASVENGVLTVTLTRHAPVRRKIAVSAG